MLILHGHREADIGEYEIGKFRAYVAAAVRVDAARRKNYVLDTHAAVVRAMSKDGAEKYLGMLDKVAS